MRGNKSAGGWTSICGHSGEVRHGAGPPTLECRAGRAKQTCQTNRQLDGMVPCLRSYTCGSFAWDLHSTGLVYVKHSSLTQQRGKLACLKFPWQLSLRLSLQATFHAWYFKISDQPGSNQSFGRRTSFCKVTRGAGGIPTLEA